MTRLWISLTIVLCWVSTGICGPYGPGAPAKGDPPKAAGEYRIKDSEGKIKYIGETQDLNRRKSEHERSGKLGANDSFSFKQAKPDFTVDDRRQHEKGKIQQHKPYYNKSNGGEGRKKK